VAEAKLAPGFEQPWKPLASNSSVKMAGGRVCGFESARDVRQIFIALTIRVIGDPDGTNRASRVVANFRKIQEKSKRLY
jgi:hypothetical protein